MAKFMKKGLKELEGGDARFDRPPPELDRPYQIIRGEEVEVSHPKVIKGSPRQLYPQQPIIHYGGIGTGSALNKDSGVRSEFAMSFDVKALDSGFEAIMDSIDGNRKESFCIIRGISDYTDGQRGQEWQPHAALAAAAFMKTLVTALPTEEEDDD
jgi:nucleoside phosphorylase